MGSKKPSALAGAKGLKLDLYVTNLSAMALRDCHRRHLEKELGSKRALQLAYACGARSITRQRAPDARFRICWSRWCPAVLQRHPVPIQ